ncbi:LysE family transporter [Paenibacillus sp. MMS20-IR301]|uniref:LysE family translocator n=1 Tax=Paenibacillus sp. MMS20-IR301 TaxID=2895946 RepID=UPI0028E8F6F6|nr:LysE family transporter [Paenibacillus sp. MMS20-IR301]WNS46226.1 LysE family transporter [Paenibacillus sp. MMS20-IR301]
MSHWPALLSGLGFGFIIAAPVGPMSVLCMNRTLKSGFSSGLATGAGIALADGIYALAAVAGSRFVNEFTSDYALPLRLLGSLFIGYLGVKGLSPAPVSAEPEAASRSGISYSLLTSFLLTLANPATLLSFVALAASLGSAIGTSLYLPAGIAIGSCSWWLLLSGLIVWISGRLPAGFSRILRPASSVLLLLYSLYGILSA